MVASDTATISGIDTPAPLSIRVPAEADVRALLNGSPASNVAMVNNDDTLQLSATASDVLGGSVTVSVTIGGGDADWVITTRTTDPEPDPFAFTAVDDADPGAVVESDTVTIGGINIPATLAVTAPAGANVGLIVNGAPAPGATTVNNGDTLQLAATAGTTPGDTVTVGVTIGGIEAAWVITTGVRPTAGAGDDLTGAPGAEVTLQGKCSHNPYGRWHQMEHQWTQLSGPPVTLTHPQTSQPASKFGDPRLTIPTDADDGATLEFQLTVTDQEGKSDSDTVLVTVQATNTPPVVAELAAARVFAGDTVRLTGQATDAEDAADALSYRWEQTGGTPEATLEEANSSVLSFTAPAVSGATALTFRLSVTDSGGLTARRDATVTILPTPTANAGPDLTGAPGAEVALQGTDSTNPYGEWWRMEHQWTQLYGPSVTLTHPQAEQYNQAADKFGDPRFTLPSDVAAGTTLEFQLTVTDEEGGSDTDTVTVTVASLAFRG